MAEVRIRWLVACAVLASVVILLSYATVFADMQHPGVIGWTLIIAGLGLLVALGNLGLGSFVVVLGLATQFILLTSLFYTVEVWWQRRKVAQNRGA